ncbi:MAG: ATP-binding protein [Syntrophobacteraceae bacterium]
MINLPLRMAALLQGWNDEVSSAVSSTISQVQPILLRNEAPFFPDYTDHGIQHVQSVLNTCELVMSEEAWNEFTRQDAALLILAILAHDLGMLVNLDGFRALISYDEREPLVEPQDEPWEKVWREFQSEVRRFDGTTLMNLLGSPEPIDTEELVPANLSERGMKIVGEFLRRRHHRLAHEIVLLGMPCENGRLTLFGGVSDYLRDLAGIVARSHGVPIRDCIESIIRRDRTAHRSYRGLHPTFLMAIIRLADYLDLDVGRAPGSVLSAKSLRSPVSRREWWSHQAVLDCHSFGEDPECLRIVVEASALVDIGTYTVTEEKIKGIQEELDSCWAVLGEVYGRFPPLNKLGLRLRRVRSDLREPAIIERLPFVPHKAALESARADLLKLLIEPLYGDSPSIGIRELIQNAVDAVRELEFILKKKPSYSAIDREQLASDIAVYFEKDDQEKWWVTVADRGIGMTSETVRKYYLTAGASFRRSDAWKKEFAEASGQSQVLRSGRFGVGVLSAFLLGDRIRVSTRHIEEPEGKGIRFEFGFDDSMIEMRWVRRKVGTTVSIRTTGSMLARLHDPYDAYFSPRSWDWYCLDKPTLTQRDQDGKIVKPKYKLSGADGPLPANWHRIQAPGFQSIDWSYDTKSPDVVCNGIVIPLGVIRIEEQFEPTGAYFSNQILKNPNVSIFDPDGRLPLNLARDRLARTSVGFESPLVDDICRNFVAFCVMRGPQSRCLLKEPLSAFAELQFPGCHPYYRELTPYLFDAHDGFGLTDPWNLSSLSSGKILLIRGPSDLGFNHLFVLENDILSAFNEYDAIIPIKSYETLKEFDQWHRRLILCSTDERLPMFKGLNIKGLMSIMTNQWYDRLVQAQRKFVMRLTNLESIGDKLKLWSVGAHSVDAKLTNFADYFNAQGISFESFTEVNLSPCDERPLPGRIARMWKDSIGGPIIPYDPGSRQSIITRLAPQFQRHLAQWAPKEGSK